MWSKRENILMLKIGITYVIKWGGEEWLISKVRNSYSFRNDHPKYKNRMSRVIRNEGKNGYFVRIKSFIPSATLIKVVNNTSVFNPVRFQTNLCLGGGGTQHRSVYHITHKLHIEGYTFERLHKASFSLWVSKLDLYYMIK